MKTKEMEGVPVDANMARVAELERELGEACALVARMDCGHHATQRNRSVESGEDFCDSCRIAEMLRDALTMEQTYKRERDEARKELADLKGDDDAWRRTYEETHAALLESEADAARLREALEKYGEHTSLCDADLDATPCPPCSCGFHEVITEMDGLRGRAALASAWNHGFTKGREYEALDTLEAMQRVGEFTLGEGIDLAAVVAKAVKP